MTVLDTIDESARDSSLEAATDAVRSGGLVVLPTDTVYGVGCDAFDARAVDALLDAKGRGREVPPPVLIADGSVLHALAVDVAPYVEDLADAFWPGALTLIVTAQPSLTWDLGETRGTVALRMPDNPVALDLLKRTGPMAVTSANRHGRDAATTVVDAAAQLGDQIEVYLDGGRATGGVSSTIIDTTVEPPEIVREGALSKDEIIAKVGDIFAAPEDPESESETDAVTDGADTGAASEESSPETDAATSLLPLESADEAAADAMADPAELADGAGTTAGVADAAAVGSSDAASGATGTDTAEGTSDTDDQAPPADPAEDARP